MYVIIINGILSNANNLQLDSGFFFGRGAFETFPVTNSPFFLEDHLSRLNKALMILNINSFIEPSYIEDIIKAFNISNCVLKIAVSEKNIVITTRPFSYTQEKYAEGFNIVLSELKRNPYSTTSFIKSFNYTDNIMEKEKYVKQGFDEVIFLNTNNKLSEGSASNIFFVKSEKLYTPTIECGLLDGIVRKWIINNFTVEQGFYTLDDLIASDEIFLTNSVMGVMKVSAFNGKTFNKTTKYNSILDLYRTAISGF
jgi:4-amino-4-deoxychorismate lyase